MIVGFIPSTSVDIIFKVYLGYLPKGRSLLHVQNDVVNSITKDKITKIIVP